MAKITPKTVSSGYNLNTINENFQALATELQNKVLYRNNPTGEPNQLEQQLDMNSNRVINLLDAVSPSEPATLRQLQALASGAPSIGVGKVLVIATAGQTVFSTATYVPGGNNLNIYINGVRQSASSYTETSTTSVTFSEGLGAGDEVEFIINEQSALAGTVSSSAVTYSGGNATAVLDRVIRYFPTFASAVADVTVGIGDRVTIGERANGEFEIVAPGGENGFDIVTGDATRSLQLIVNGAIDVRQFGAKLDGTDDSAAIQACVDYLPSTGGEIIIGDSDQGCLVSTQIDSNKPIKWSIGNIVITGPAVGWIIDLQSNSSKIIGNGETTFKLTTPTTPVSSANLTAVITAGALTSLTINDGGSGYVTEPIIVFTGGGFTEPCSALLTISGGAVNGYIILEAGSGYAAPPSLYLIGGGAGAIRNKDPLHTELSGFKVDMSSIPYALGVFHYGGWYVNYKNIWMDRTTIHSTAIGFSSDSRTLGVPGPTGSYGGSYVNTISNITTNVICMVGHDTSTQTTTTFTTIDVNKVILKACVGFSFINPVVQDTGANLVFWDLTLCRALTIIAGDYEGGGAGSVIYLLNGTGNTSLQTMNNLYGSFTGVLKAGTLGENSQLQDYLDGNTETPLRVGTSGSAGMRYNNSGFLNSTSIGAHYDGNVANFSQNLKQINATQGDLEDESKAGALIHINTSGQVKVMTASAGSNPRTLTQTLLIEQGQIKSTGKANLVLSDFADNAAALAGGLVIGDLYRITGAYTVNIVA